MTTPDQLAVVDARGADFAFTDEGAGALAVYAHALSHDHDSLAGPGGLLDLQPVAAIRRLVRYDARGHGRSTGHPVPEEYAFTELAADLLALLDVWSPAVPAAGIGTSMGTATLLHAATRRPGRFSRLVLTAPPTAWETRAGQAAGYRGLADAIAQNGLAPMAATLREAATPPLLRGEPPIEPSIPESLLPSVLRGVAPSDLPDPEAIARLRLPVLVLSWAGDPGHPVSTGERLAELIPDARFQVAHSRDEIAGWPAQIAAFLQE